MFGRSKRSRNPFESRTQVWREVGLGGEVDREKAQRARGVAAVIVLLIAGVLVAFSQRRDPFPGAGTEARIATVVALVLLGWALARSLGRGFAPALLGRLDPGGRRHRRLSDSAEALSVGCPVRDSVL